mmetsp:Transcript_7294/g.13643  ORF Transcript_7294/g.13643 Transcript_7294/m.13643 type:complete len:113 (+) Transcript_7294:1393-1731(+)|eukprot:CAMPEP_0197533390 /NCGR_PEP_ID=MMETSP1318-20131121/43361_1 /TAXON_ID=552666 /ORGANISM="Partenskyella glossopodia, Strain RCC365" /LENGTH=112 /DNA_ID=CAMNT_0043090275 /DNA_START=1334 /DNA_END=1672 /DNA_ORIENTATION=-
MSNGSQVYFQSEGGAAGATSAEADLEPEEEALLLDDVCVVDDDDDDELLLFVFGGPSCGCGSDMLYAEEWGGLDDDGIITFDLCPIRAEKLHPSNNIPKTTNTSNARTRLIP